MTKYVALTPDDFSAGDPALFLKEMPEIYLECCRQAQSSIGGAEVFVLDCITFRKSGLVNVEFRVVAADAEHLPLETASCAYQHFANPGEAKAYHDRVEEEELKAWKRTQKTLRGIAKAFR